MEMDTAYTHWKQNQQEAKVSVGETESKPQWYLKGLTTKNEFEKVIGATILLTGCSSTPAKPEEPKTEKKETEERQKTASEPGVKKSVKDIDVILESSNANIQLSLAGTNVEPKAGHIFIETTFTIKNNSDKELNMNSVPAYFYGTADGKGEIYPSIVGDLAGAKRLEGVIKKGESATGLTAVETI